MKTSELTGALLDYAVAKIKGYEIHLNKFQGGSVMVCDHEVFGHWGWEYFHPTTDARQAYEIIKREKISVFIEHFSGSKWCATYELEVGQDWRCTDPSDGEDPLEAAMRCFVFRKHGPEIDIPKELLA